MKLWIDDVRPEPYGYRWVKSVNEAKKLLSSEFYRYEKENALLANRTFPTFKEANSYLFSTMQKWGDKFPHAVGTVNEVWYYSDQPIIPHDVGVLVRIDAKLNQF